MDKAKYLVTVFDRQLARTVDSTSFPVGEWKEIGYWLDNCGYIDSRYTIGINVTEA